MRSRFFVMQGFCVLLVAGALALTAGLGRGQSLGSYVEIKREFDKVSSKFRDLMTGEAKPVEADKAVADAAAKWYIHRITHKLPPVPPAANIQIDFEKFVISAEAKRKENAVFVNQYVGPAMVANMKQVLALDMKESPAIVINGCMMLPTMARLRSDAIAEYLTSLVKDNQTNDAIRLYALRALSETMPITIYDPLALNADTKEWFARRARDTKNVEALASFIERPVKSSGVDARQLELTHYLRREAIASLSNAGVPAVALQVSKGKTVGVEGPIAPTLLKVLDPKGMQPPVSLQEKIDAAVGLCVMRYPNISLYSPDPAVYLVGRTMVEVVRGYNLELPNFTLKGKDRKLPTIAWKTEAKRLEYALKELKANTTTGAAKNHAEKLEAMALPLLKAMQNHQQTDVGGRLLEFNNMVPAMRPSTGVIFKGMKYDMVLPN